MINPKLEQTLAKLLFPFVKSNKIDFLIDYYKYISETIITEGKDLIKKFGSNKYKIPILFMNGKKDTIAPFSMTLDLNKRIPKSKIYLFEELGHGNLILGKGNKKIMKTYIKFITSKSNDK